MDRFTRILLMHRILSAARTPVPRTRLQQELECSPASIKRIIAELRDYVGAPIVYDREANGYYYATQGGKAFELPGLWFSTEELLAFASMLELMSELGPGLLDQALRPFRRRLEQLLQTQTLGLKELPRRLKLLPLAGRAAPPKVFRTIATATLNRQRLAARYHARSRDDRCERELSPQRIVHYRNAWYLHAWCHLRDELRIFALERLESVRLLDQSAHTLPDAELDAHYTPGYGLFAGPATAEAVLRFSPYAARWVAEETWHPDQKSAWLDDGRYELRVPYSNPTELIMDVMRYGPEVEVVEPVGLRKQVRDRLARALERYVEGIAGSDSETVPVLDTDNLSSKPGGHQ